MLASGVPSLPPRADLIHSLDCLRPIWIRSKSLVDWEKLRAANLRFVADPMHGSARGLLATLMHRHGIACDEIRGTRDPLFGGVNPEPIEPHVAALRVAVREGGYDAGFAADGDGDRIGAMDRDGTFITPHQIFSILLLASGRHAQIAGRSGQDFLHHQAARQNRRALRPQSLRSARGLQVHLRTDAGARHLARRRRVRRHRNQVLSSRSGTPPSWRCCWRK